MVERENLAVLKANKKRKNLRNRRSHAHQNWFACISHEPLFAWIFWADFIFWPPWTIVHGWKGKFGRFEGKQKEEKSPKPEKPRPPKLVCMHFTWTSICMNFLSRFHFLTPMDYSPWFEGKIWPFWTQTKRGKISETGEATPTKIGLHAFQITLYLHEFFESNLFFDPHGL